MLIERIAFKDFLVFPGEQEMLFAFKDSKNLSLILAPNNSGKTTVIRALEFLLYSEKNQSKQAKLPCHARIEKMSPRQEDESWVEVTIRSGAERLRVRRAISFMRKNADTLDVQPVECTLTAYTLGKIGDDRLPTTTASEDKVANLVPRAMFDFYFFKGEELADKLLQSNRNVEIPKQLKKVLYQQEWDRVCETLGKVERSVNREIAVITKNSQEYDDLMLTRDGMEQSLKKLNTQLEKEAKRCIDLTSSHKEADDKIEELVFKADPSRQKELEKTKKRLGEIEVERKRLIVTRKEILGKFSPLLLSVGTFERTRALLVGLKEKRALPPDIAEALLVKLIDKEVCVCERECPKGSAPFMALEALREESLGEEVAEDLWKLHASTDPSNQRGLWFTVKEKTAELKDLEARSAGLAAAQTTLEQEKAELEAATDEGAEISLRKEKVRRQEIQLAMAKSDRAQSDLKQQIRGKEQSLNMNEEKVRKAKLNAGNVGHLTAAADASAMFRKLAERCHSNLVTSMYKELNTDVRDMYAGIVSDGSIAVVDKETLMPSIERAGVRGLYAGGGQSQVLLLCYLIALARLRKTINTLLREQFDVAHFREQSFFMDSVFGQTQGDYKRGVAKLLPEHMTQLVMLLAGQQWDTNVEGGFEGTVSNAYGFELVTPRDDLADEDYEFTFHGETINLLSRTQPGAQAYTKIVKLS